MLGTMVGFAALIAKAEALPAHGEQVLAYAQRIHRAGGRMNRLIGDLVDLASIGAGSLAVTREIGDPTPILMEAVDTFHAQALASGVSLVAEIAPLLPLVAFDAARILQVLANLLSNAIKFTPPNGQVIVRADRVGDDIRFAVSDTGVGVPPDQLEAVFERYVQVRKGDRRGVGLGLYISKCIVHGHGGKIWVESTLGQGSVFRFTLPIPVAPRDESAARAADRLHEVGPACADFARRSPSNRATMVRFARDMAHLRLVDDSPAFDAAHCPRAVHPKGCPLA